MQTLIFKSAKLKCRILLIDDDNDALPISDLQADEYAITQIYSVSPVDLRECEQGKYDVIVLDYNGVAPLTLCPDDGFGVFSRIRAANPQQYIIAISAQKYDISQTAYLKEANDYIKKPSNLAETKNSLDEAIKHNFNPNIVYQRIEKTLIDYGVDYKQARKVVDKLKKVRSSDSGEYMKIISSVNSSLSTINSIISLSIQLVKCFDQ